MPIAFRCIPVELIIKSTLRLAVPQSILFSRCHRDEKRRNCKNAWPSELLRNNTIRSGVLRPLFALASQGTCDVNMSPDLRLWQSIISAKVHVYAFQVEDPLLY